MSVRRATHVKGGYHHESSALIMMRDIFSLCALVLLYMLFICGQHLAPQADSGCSQCQIGPDTSGAGRIIIVCHVQIGKGRQADRFTHFCIWFYVRGHTSLKIRSWNNNQFIVLLRLGKIFNSTDWFQFSFLSKMKTCLIKNELFHPLSLIVVMGNIALVNHLTCCFYCVLKHYFILCIYI